MKKCLIAAMLAAIIALSASAAFAEEYWSPHLCGSDEGFESALLPPKGVYFSDDNYFTSMAYFQGSKETPLRVDAYVNVPVLLWNPGCKVLNATYAVALVQPFDYLNLYSRVTPGLGNAHWGAYNTVVVPYILSWKLPKGLAVKTQLATYINDPSTSVGHPAGNGGADSGNNFWTIEPEAAVTWVNNGYNLSADLKYDCNFKDTATQYQSGDLLCGDYTATKSIKNWTAGVGAYSVNQVKDDSLNGATVPNSIRLGYALGPIIGYQFGGISVQGTFNWKLKTENDFGGNFLNIRFVMPIK